MYVLLLLLAGIVALDTTGGPQVLVSEPVICCSLAGLIFGLPDIGLFLGIFFQLFWFGYLPLGAVRIPDGNIGALTATSSLIIAAVLFNMNMDATLTAAVPALLLGTAAAHISSRMQMLVRRNNARISESVVSRLEHGRDVSMCTWHTAGMASSFARGVVTAIVFIPLGVLICGSVAVLPAGYVTATAKAVPAIWGTACASAVIVSILKNRVKPLILGAVVGILWLAVKINGVG